MGGWGVGGRDIPDIPDMNVLVSLGCVAQGKTESNRVRVQEQWRKTGFERTGGGGGEEERDRQTGRHTETERRGGERGGGNRVFLFVCFLSV